MLDWIKNINKEFPEFWKNYLSKFESKSNRFVILSTETSGLSLSKDEILSIGDFSIINDK
jgi:DNA polymerase-3 subunit epsilon